jgi:uncharacterized DUF497 family protein
MRITHDPSKRDWTLRERGLDFDQAAEIFVGRHVSIADVRKDYGEPRFITAGWLNGRMVVLVWTPRVQARRVISMRYAHAKEERRWRRFIG